MSTQHAQTIAYYNTNADEFIARTRQSDMSPCQNRFLSYLPAGARILDAGCGSGRDSKYFLEQGMRVTAIDASEEMCRRAGEYIGQAVECLRFDELPYENAFDGIWACASLLHVPKKELPEVIRLFHRALSNRGILYASVKFGTGEEVRLERFFSDYTLEEFCGVFADGGLFEVMECFETEDERPDYKSKPWVNVICRRI